MVISLSLAISFRRFQCDHLPLGRAFYGGWRCCCCFYCRPLLVQSRYHRAICIAKTHTFAWPISMCINVPTHQYTICTTLSRFTCSIVDHGTFYPNFHAACLPHCIIRSIVAISELHHPPIRNNLCNKNETIWMHDSNIYSHIVLNRVFGRFFWGVRKISINMLCSRRYENPLHNLYDLIYIYTTKSTHSIPMRIHTPKTIHSTVACSVRSHASC